MSRPRKFKDAEPGEGLRERQKRQRGERILGAAARLFNERGYDQVSIEDIAHGAEVSAATVHNYYETKGQLLLAIVERGDATILEFAADLARSALTDARATLNHLLERTTTMSLAYLDHRVWRNAIAISITREDPEYGTGFAEVHRSFIDTFERVIVALVAKSLLPADVDARTLASILYRVQHALFIELIGEVTVDLAAYRAKQVAHVDFLVGALTCPA